MLSQITATEYDKILKMSVRRLKRIKMPWHRDIWDLAHCATEVYFRRDRKASIKFCVVDAIRKTYGRDIKRHPRFASMDVYDLADTDYPDNLVDLIAVKSAYKDLSKVEIEIIERRLSGLLCKEIAKERNLTESRISQILTKAIKKIRVLL